VGFTPQIAAAGIAVDPDDPNDHVGSAIEANVSTAVGKTLAAATRGLPVLQFRAPSQRIAFAGN